MSQAISSAHRVLAWNIVFVTLPPHNDWRAGTFQPIPSTPSPLPSPQFLTWRMLFHDVALCFDIQPYLDAIAPSASPSSSGKDIGLWVRKELGDITLQDESSILPCIYMNGAGQILDQPVAFSKLGTLPPAGGSTGGDVATIEGHDQDDEEARLYLSLVFHDCGRCGDTERANVHAHMENGCLIGINLTRNPTFRFIPIPSSASRPLQTPTSRSPASRSLTTPPSRSSQTGSNTNSKRPYPAPTSAASSASSSRQTPLRAAMPDLVKDIRVLYQGTCVITKQNTSWVPGNMFCGPGIEVAHIIPKSMYMFYPGAANEGEGWRLTNSPRNCVLLDSLTHAIHDNRLIAIHPSSQRIRLFAPVKPLLRRSNRLASFGGFRPAWESLDWHYNMCVVESMCAILLQEEGGAKRTLKRGLAISEMDEGAGDGSTESVEDNDDVGESGDGQSNAAGPWPLSSAGGSGLFTRAAVTELHGHREPSCSISVSRRNSVTTVDASPPTPPELLSFGEILKNSKHNAQVELGPPTDNTTTKPQSSRGHPRLRIYTSSSVTMPTDVGLDEHYDDYGDSGEDQDIFFLDEEDKEETSRRRRKVSEELSKWANGEVRHAGEVPNPRYVI
ncbi:MAG: hypothetical protein M1840_003593 [Geoglossum simile]|nr:MAG: hypothetical protein M1840_003593 [Geoglossum simile]